MNDPNGREGNWFTREWESALSGARMIKKAVTGAIENVEKKIIEYAQESTTKRYELGFISLGEKNAAMRSAAALSATFGTAAQLFSNVTVNAGGNALEGIESTATKLGEGAAKVATGEVCAGLYQMADITGLMSAGEMLGEGAFEVSQGDYAEGATKIAGGTAIAATSSGIEQSGRSMLWSGVKDVGYGTAQVTVGVFLLSTALAQTATPTGVTQVTGVATGAAGAWYLVGGVGSLGLGAGKISLGLQNPSLMDNLPGLPPILDMLFTPGYPQATEDLIRGRYKK